jgi:hypothetical protein
MIDAPVVQRAMKLVALAKKMGISADQAPAGEAS